MHQVLRGFCEDDNLLDALLLSPPAHGSGHAGECEPDTQNCAGGKP